MRSIVKGLTKVLAALLLAAPLASSFPAVAQEAQEAAPAPALPSAPLPYTQIRPKAAPARPRPATAKPVTTNGPGVAGGAPIAGAATTLAGLPTLVTGARLSASQPIPTVELEAFVDGVVRDAMAQDHVAGVAVSVVQNGQVILNKGYGFAGLEPQRSVDPNRTLFRLGSISKTFTWITLMKEVEAGRIRLNQPVNLYLPEKLQIRDQGYDQPIRVSHLLDHSAGFEDRALGHLFEQDFERVRPLELYLRQERPRRVHAPGALSSYSNYGAALAGEAASYTSGKPFERLVEEEIFVPLGLRHTTFREPRRIKEGLPAPMPQALAPDVSEGFRWEDGAFRRRSYEFIGQIAPAGAALSTSGDMARYMLLLLGNGSWNGVTIYSPTTAQAFRTPLRATPRGINGWAHGFATYDLPGGFRGYGHGGDTIAFHSNLVVAPQLNLGIFIATNSDEGEKLAARLPDRLVRQFYAAPVGYPRPGSPELAARAADYDGRYLTTRRAYHGLEGFVDRLIGDTAVHVTPAGRLVTTSRGVTRAWTPEGPLVEGRFISAMGDERLLFRMADGVPVSIQTASNAQTLEKVSLLQRPMSLAVLAALTVLAAMATLIGLALRNRREFRENAIQSRTSLIQNIQAGLWLAALALFAVWAAGAQADEAAVIYNWPGSLPIIASACALVAAILTLVTVLALPAIWRGGRRVDSWPPTRRAAFTVTVLIYAAFAVTLGLWGALLPWSG